MQRIIKKILVLCFVISGMFLVSSKCFADNYNIKIVLAGKIMAGKTNVGYRLCGMDFETKHRPTGWVNNGVSGFHTSYPIGDDVFNCYFFDAPGLLRNENLTVNQQLEMIPKDDISLVFIVIDPLDRNRAAQYSNSISEACERCLRIYEGNNNLGVVIIVNKSDTLNQEQMEMCESLLQNTIDSHTTTLVDEKIPESERNFMKGVIVSAKDNIGFDSLVDIIKDFLRLKKENFRPDRGTRFKICAYDDCPRPGKLFTPTVNDGSNKYCCKDCLLNAEGFLCSYEECPNRRNGRKFLKNDNGVVKYENEYYCCGRCLHEAKGQACANDKNCSDGRPKLLPYEGVASKNEHSEARYCSEKCRHNKEDSCSIM